MRSRTRSMDVDAGMYCWMCSDCGDPARYAHSHPCSKHPGGTIADAYYCDGEVGDRCGLDFTCDDCWVPHENDERSMGYELFANPPPVGALEEREM